MAWRLLPPGMEGTFAEGPACPKPVRRIVMTHLLPRRLAVPLAACLLAVF